MRETLYIRLRSASPDAVTTYRVDGEMPGRVERAALGEILANAGSRRIVVLVPAAAVRIEKVALPIRNAGKLLKAVPYALEDALADDVDSLHFALGPRAGDGSHAVAVVGHQTMQEWLTPFAEHELKPDALIPEPLCLPAPEADLWHVLVEADQVCVRTAQADGFSCDRAALSDYLALADPKAEQRLCLHISDGEATDFSELKWPVELRPGYGDPLDALLEDMAALPPLNLLQGDYSQKQNLRKLWLPWLIPAALAASWLLLSLVHTALDTQRLGGEADQLYERNVVRFKQVFPREQRVVDLRTQLNQQLAGLGDGGNQSGLFSLIDSLGPALEAANGLSLQGIQFRDGQVFLSLTGKDVQALERMRAWYQTQGDMQVEVQANDVSNEGVRVRVKLSAA